MTDKELANLLDEQIAKYSRENRHLEFKSNYQDANSLGEYISALIARSFVISAKKE